MRHNVFQIDWRLFVPAIFLVIISLTILFSINSGYFFNQLFALIISLVVFVIFSQISYRDLRRYSLPAYLLSVILLLVVFVIGFESRGAVRWVEIFGISLQASEIGKPLIALALAGFLAGSSNRKLKTYILPLVFLAPAVYLIYLQPDLGNAILFAGVGILTLIIFGLPYKWLIIGSLPVLMLSPYIWNLLHEYQRQRIMSYINPLKDPEGSSYNLIQAIIAAGSGGIFGKGIGEGTQSHLKFLPENHTDFIFASLAEKLGFLGSLIVIISFAFLLYRLYQIFGFTKDTFGKIFVAFSFLFIILQFFINIGMNLGLVPVVGITLPFVSYGGSSLLANFIMLGILSSISIGNKKREVLEIK